MVKISIVVVTYNSQKLIEDCISSVGAYLDIEPGELEIIIVDNSSGDDAVEIRNLVKDHPLNKTIKIIYSQNTINLGYGQGNNVGIKLSGGEIVCIMNPDVRFGSAVLKDVINKFNNQNLALLSYKQIGGFNYSFYQRPEFKSVFSNIITKLANKIDKFFPDYFLLSGAFFFIDKKKFTDVGLFDQNIFMYYEEADVTKRLLEKKYQIVYDNSKIYYHLIGDREDYSEKAFGNELESLKYYLKKHNFDDEKVVKNYLGEYKIKNFIASILNDSDRQAKFKKEVTLIKTIFGIKF
ncbi:glycosyltransferase family 2 protein [Chryseobacterium sp. MP_3.2]|uniref:glycosyltransferase family 2 protein n=1 Tax=Chryseobacterium sp. MP_3.2 TaxID=3071712 RepID=UPI002DFAD546|nr:GT2 family glycosyltransferase [Chryseobacterium sp. MP_3.2]